LRRDDPFLRGRVIYLMSRGPTADASMMGEHFPDLHRVFTDSQGSVWSAAHVDSSR
jgi:hypothetical protein